MRLHRTRKAQLMKGTGFSPYMMKRKMIGR